MLKTALIYAFGVCKDYEDIKKAEKVDFFSV